MWKKGQGSSRAVTGGTGVNGLKLKTILKIKNHLGQKLKDATTFRRSLNVIIKSMMDEMRTNINVKDFLGDTSNNVKNANKKVFARTFKPAYEHKYSAIRRHL